MKKILLILSLAVIHIAAFSQAPKYQNIGSTLGNNMVVLNPVKGLGTPRYCDTTFALVGVYDTLGLQILDTCSHPNKWYQRQANSDGVHYWQLSSGGSGGSETWQQTLINGSNLSQNNTVNGGHYDFTINHTNSFDIVAGDFTHNTAEVYVDSASGAYLYAQNDGGTAFGEVKAYSNGNIGLDATGSGSSFIHLNADGTIVGTASSFIELSNGSALIDIGTGSLISFQSSAGTYNYTNLVTDTLPDYIATFKNNNLVRTLASNIVIPSDFSGNIFYPLAQQNAPPVSPTTGDVYLVGTAGSGAWSGHNNDIATYNGATWDFTDATVGDISVISTPTSSITYRWNGSAWVVTSPFPFIVGGNVSTTNLNFGAASNVPVTWVVNGLQRMRISPTDITFNRGANSYIFPATRGTNGQVIQTDASGNLSWATVGTGSVTSVAATVTNTGLTVSGSPITTSGTLAFTWTGAVQGDLPIFTGTNTLTFLNKSTTATRYLSNQGTSNNPSWNQVNLANGVTGVLPIANGGTNNGSLTVTNQSLIYADGTKLVSLGVGTSRQKLGVVGGNLTWVDSTAAGGGENLDQTMAIGSAITTNRTITGAFTFAINTSRLTTSQPDSISLNSTNSLSLTSLAGVNIWGVTNTIRATTTTVTATSIGTFEANTGTGDSTGWHIQLAGGRIGTYWLGASNYGVGTNGDSLMTYNPVTKRISASSPNSFLWWTRAGTGAIQRIYPTNTSDTVNIGTSAANNGSLFYVGGTAKINSNAAVGTGLLSTAGLNVSFSNATDLYSSVRAAFSSSGSSAITQQAVLGSVSDNGGAGSGKFLYGVYGVYSAQAGSGTAGTGAAVFGEAQINEAPATTVSNPMAGVASRFQLGNANVLNSTAINVYGFWGRAILNNSSAVDSVRNYHAIHLDSILSSLVSGSNSYFFEKGTNSWGFAAGKMLHGYTSTGDTIPTMQLQMGAGRFGTAKGADVASAGDLTLGTDGNVFHITGTTTINAITTANWQAGSTFILIFDGSVTVKNNTAGGGGTAVMKLAGAADFSATASDVLTLVWDGTSFFEVSRSVN